MGDTGIEYVEKVLNVSPGCTRVSSGCDHCFAMAMAWRLMHSSNEQIRADYAGLVERIPPPLGAGDGAPGKRPKAKYRWTGRVNRIDRRLREPLENSKPTTYFINSMGDLFHENQLFAWIYKVFEMCLVANNHKFIIVTKRSGQMRAIMERIYPKLQYNYPEVVLPLANVMAMVTVEDQAHDFRIRDLLADIKWRGLPEPMFSWRAVSYEPAVGALVNNDDECLFSDALDSCKHCGMYSEICNSGMNGGCQRFSPSLDWVVAGGESGPGARPSNPDWFRAVRDQCAEAGVPFFFKQWGEWTPNPLFHPKNYLENMFVDLTSNGKGSAFRMKKIGKKKAGCMLDGREHKEYPGIFNNPPPLGAGDGAPAAGDGDG